MSRIPEKSIAVEAVKVVEEFGEISMTELIKELTERMEPEGHDLEIIQNRNDTYFSQKVRNLRSHNNRLFFGNVHYSEESGLYISNKCYELKSRVSKQTYDQTLTQKKEKTRKFYARKTDFDKINKERKLIGDKGELLVLDDQKEKVKKVCPDYRNQVRHVSKLDGDGAGFDILSFDDKCDVIYIEVKSTVGGINNAFYMSATEYGFYELHKDNYVIARVYDLDVDTGRGKIKYIRGSSFETNFDKEVSGYKVWLKEE